VCRISVQRSSATCYSSDHFEAMTRAGFMRLILDIERM
jgi:hypothetical protein